MSRQRDWQLKQKDLGRCLMCGKAVSLKNKRLCDYHREKHNIRRRKPPTSTP